MNRLIKNIAPAWRASLGVLLLGLAMSIVYGFGWRFGLPLELRNYSGLVLFGCIMFGPAVAYAGARFNGATVWLSTKIGLFLALIWHLKEICMASKIFGIGPGIYAGIQGYYWAYYGLVLVFMGVIHLGIEFYIKMTAENRRSIWRGCGYFFLPLFAVLSIEAFGFLVFDFDLFLFRGFLMGYRALFM